MDAVEGASCIGWPGAACTSNNIIGITNYRLKMCGVGRPLL